MEGFLKKVANHLFQMHGDQIRDLTLVFPNRRAGVFFSNYLNTLIHRPIISPEMITIDQLFEKNSDLFVVDRLSLVFRLYKVFIGVTHSNETFDDFYFWGDMLLSDFDQVDKYGVDANLLFSNVTDLKEIDERFGSFDLDRLEVVTHFWQTLSGSNKSPNQQEFIRLWQDLSGLYQKFKAELFSERLAYQGMLYRDVIENLSAFNLEKLGTLIYFIGFNALNRCEEQLFDYLQEKEKAFFFWDYDNYYYENTNQEAGLFLRKNLPKYPAVSLLGDMDNLKSGEKDIEVISISSSVGQAQVVAKLMEETPSGNGFDDTAIILCDEELLLPVVQALPESVGQVNVTMGYPFKLTPVFSLINQLVDLQRNVKVFSGKNHFYSKDLIRVLGNQLVSEALGDLVSQFANRIRIENLVYIPVDDLPQSEIIDKISIVPQGLTELSNYFSDLIQSIFAFWQLKTGSLTESEEIATQDQNATLFCEYLYQAFLTTNRFREILVVDGQKVFGREDYMSRESFFRFLLQHLSVISVPFEGEPLQGLQVMGILETRTLDFKRVVLLSANEGIMPRISASGSFIPYNLRRAFGLPTIEEQNAMYAYYFYRVLQRAQQITFVYDSSASGSQTGEKSRYLYQLELESPFAIKTRDIIFQVENVKPRPIIIEKDEAVVQILNHYLEGKRVLSPSAIDKYISCSLHFYYQYIANLKEYEETTEEVDAIGFGLIFHSAIEQLYTPFAGQLVEKKMLEQLLEDSDQIDQTIRQAFASEFFKNKDEEITLTGRNWLIFEIVKRYIRQLLFIDQQWAPFMILGLEHKVRSSISLKDERKVILGGTIDRMDLKDGKVYIFDYKTGSVDLSVRMLSDLFDRELETRNKAACQTLIYSYVLSRSERPGSMIYPGIYPLRSFYEKDFDPLLRLKEIGNESIEYSSVASEFEPLLKQMLNELFDKNIPFQQTNVVKRCEHCPYKGICRR